MDVNKAYELITQKLLLWLRDIVKLLPNILLSAVIMAIGFLIAI